MSSIYLNTNNSSSSSTSSSSLIRVPGMASGLDTDSIVKSMVSSYQNKIDKANQSKQLLQWKQDSYRDIIKGIKGLQEYFDPLSDKYILSDSSYNTKSVNNTNSTIASATVSSNASLGNYTVNVKQLAEQANITGTPLNSMFEVNTTDQNSLISNWSNANLTLTSNFKLDSITNSTDFSALVTGINNKISASSTLSGKISASYDETNKCIVFKNTSGSSVDFGVKDSNGSPLVPSQNISANSSISISITDATKWSNANFSGGTVNLEQLDNITTDTNGNNTTLDEIVAGINNKISKAGLSGISASYVSSGNESYIKFTNSNSDSVSLTAKNSGAPPTTFIDNKTINSSVSSSSLLTDLGFKSKIDNVASETGLISFTLTNGTSSYPVSLQVTNTSTVKNLMDAVNSATNGAVTMSIDGTTGKISFQSKSYGSSSNISMTDTSTGSNGMSKLGISPTLYTCTGTMKSTDSSSISSKSLLTKLGFTSGNINFTVTNGTTNSVVSLAVSDSTTVQNLIDAVKASTGGAVTMNVDYATGKVSFHSNTDSDITINDTSSANNINTAMGMSKTKSAVASDSGKDALVSITAPGQSEVTTTQSSNKFTLNGMNYNLANIGIAASTVTSNSDTVVSNMKKFITDYNTIISTINTKLTEKKNSDYPPLTDAQKESMSESQITAWESKAKVGILRNDDYLNTLLTQMRGIFSSPVYSNYNSKDVSSGKVLLSFGNYGTNAIGIDTSTDYTDGGKLVLQDETKFKNAIESNLDDFKKLFTGASNSSLGTNESYVGSEKYKEDGIFKRMDTILRDYVSSPGVGEDGTYTLSGSMNIFVNKQYDYSSFNSSGKNTLPDQVYAQTVSISKLKTQMSDAETRYYKQFTALETALSSLSSQQSSLSAMLGTS